MTRDDWHLQMKKRLEPWFHDLGAPLPNNIRIACSWPSQGGTRRINPVVGQCWPRRLSKDGTYEIFISPTLDDHIEVAGTLIHELIHAALNCQFGHGRQFRQLALGVGLQGRMTATVVGPSLRARLNTLISEIGPYPHAQVQLPAVGALTIPLIPSEGMKKQTTRLVHCECADCGYTLWTTRKWITRYPQLPTCPCGGRFVVGLVSRGEY